MKFDENMPIYLQIVQLLKADIISGKIEKGEKLPSIRELSEIYGINPNTVQRVFSTLEAEGVVNSKRGIGSFLTDSDDLIHSLRIAQIEKYTLRYLCEMGALNVTNKEIHSFIDSFWKEKQDGIY